MKRTYPTASPGAPALTNGAGVAAILSAGLAAFALSLLAIAGDKSAHLKSMLVFYTPTGPLSGVTTVAILFWLITWALLHRLWRNRTLAIGPTSAVAFVLLGLSFLLTFPPIADFF
jgi:hypothetical protein